MKCPKSCKKCSSYGICPHSYFEYDKDPNTLPVSIPDSNKAGSKAIDVPLYIPNTIRFGVMKDLDNITYQDIKEKLTEEYKEVLVEYKNKTIYPMASELIDVMQVCYTYLKKMQNDGLIIIENENCKHLNKLEGRGIIE